MAITQEDLQEFHRFAQEKLNSAGAETLHELVDSWEVEHLSPEERRENVAAVQAAVRDMNNGDTGRPAEEISSRLRAKLTRPE